MAYAQDRRVYWSGDPGEESEEDVLMKPESEEDVLMMPQTERRVVRWTESAGDALPQLEVQLTAPVTAPGVIDSLCHLDLLFQRDGKADSRTVHGDYPGRLPIGV